MTIDVAFDFSTDTPGYPRRDPDTFSPTLRHYHKLLWSKRLPGGALFDLSVRTPRAYLYHHSELGEFWLSSDSVMQTFIRWPRMKPILDQDPPQVHDAFFTIAYTIGAMMVFPGNQVEGKPSINVARGFNRAIADRFDLTLECIRRQYLNESSPLVSTLSRYADFFALFGDFRGYVKFFLLDDLVTADGAVRFFMPFDNFGPPGSAVPKDVETYREFRRRSIDFIKARNHRIGQLSL